MIDKNYFGEGKNIEFKREIPGNHEKFLKDIIAFSNSTGDRAYLFPRYFGGLSHLRIDLIISFFVHKRPLGGNRHRR